MSQVVPPAWRLHALTRRSLASLQDGALVHGPLLPLALANPRKHGGGSARVPTEAACTRSQRATWAWPLCFGAAPSPPHLLASLSEANETTCGAAAGCCPKGAEEGAAEAGCCLLAPARAGAVPGALGGAVGRSHRGAGTGRLGCKFPFQRCYPGSPPRRSVWSECA